MCHYKSEKNLDYFKSWYEMAHSSHSIVQQAPFHSTWSTCLPSTISGNPNWHSSGVFLQLNLCKQNQTPQNRRIPKYNVNKRSASLNPSLRLGQSLVRNNSWMTTKQHRTCWQFLYKNVHETPPTWIYDSCMIKSRPRPAVTGFVRRVLCRCRDVDVETCWSSHPLCYIYCLLRLTSQRLRDKCERIKEDNKNLYRIVT
jgi:hypothetical protein